MKKSLLFAAFVAAVCSCSQDESESAFNGSPVENQKEVSLTFSPYEMTRSATSIASVVSNLDVWLYESGAEFTSVHQSSSDSGFGSLSVTLDKTKTYTLYAVGHKADGTSLTDGIISFTDDKVTHAMFYTTTFSPATTTSLNCLMNRIVASFRLEITDDIPSSAVKFRFTVSGVYDRWNVSTGGTHQLDRVSNISYGGTSKVFSVYAIVTDAQTLHTVTVTALDDNDKELQTRTFADVPLRNGYKTSYRGTFFIDTPASASFLVNDWNEYDTVDF